MFNTEFFPTPRHVASKMMAMLPKSLGSYDYILEPSAGKGDLLDFIKDISGRYRSPKMYACENDPELQMLLSEKAILLNDDFLTFDGVGYCFDLVMMNPPFSQGARHLIHAYDIVQNADIVCVLNAETVRNPYTEERKLLAKLIADYGKVEFFTNSFMDAQRKTGVEIAIVYLKKTTAERKTDMFNDLQGNTEEFNLAQALSDGTALNRPDFIRDMVGWKKGAVEGFEDLVKAFEKISYYLGPLLKGMSYTLPSIIEKSLAEKKQGEKVAHFNQVITDLSWGSIFTQADFRKVLTMRMQQNFDKHRTVQGQRVFSEENIRSLLEMLLFNQNQIIEQCIEDTFDTMTKYAEDNRVYREGWKTNDRYEVNKKVILPHFVECSKWSGGMGFASYTRDIWLNDIDKSLCFLSGIKFYDCPPKYPYDGPQEEPLFKSIYETLRTAFRTGDMECESEFFKIRMYKKGTLHLVFKDLTLHRRMNEFVWKKKGWLQDGRWKG